MSLPFDEGRDPTARREDYRSGSQWSFDEFQEKYSKLEYWRNRPLIELQIEIRRLKNEHKSSQLMAQRLRQIEKELHDEKRAQQGQKKSPKDKSPQKGRPLLPPSAISGRITGGNFPRYPTVADIHPGYSQMSPRTQELLGERHRAAQSQFGDIPQRRSKSMDRHIDQMRRYNTGLERQSYDEQMRFGTGLDIDRFRRETPEVLAQNFRDLRYRADRARELDSKYTKLASLEVWKQRQLDKKYHPKQPKQLPREHQFGPQEPQQYSEDWKHDAKKVSPFAPVMDYFGDKSTDRQLRQTKSDPISSKKSGIFKWKTRKTVPGTTAPIMEETQESTVRERSWSRSAPDISEGMGDGQSSFSTSSSSAVSRRPAFDPERPSQSQRVANSYVNEARSYHRTPRGQRIVIRRQRWPLREDEQTLGIDMSENAQEWELANRYQSNPVLAAFGDYGRRIREEKP